MPPPANVNELLDLVRKSGLVEDARLRALVQKLRAAAKPPRLPADLAEVFVTHQLLTRFQVDLLLKGKFKGFHIGDYRVLQPVGSGGMASVYLCERPKDRAQVAVKVLAKQ